MKKFYLAVLLTIPVFFQGFSQNTTNAGTDFWIAFPPNYSSSTQSLQLFISSEFSTSGSLISAYPGVNQTFTVVPGIVTQITLPSGVGLLPGVENKGIEVTSLDPVSVYGLNYIAHSTDAYLALPVNALGLDYRVVAYTQMMSYGSGLGIVATQNGTTVTVFNHQTNITSNINLDQGQTYYEETANTSEDITGSRVQSNFPVGVYGSNRCTQIPFGCTACDHINEMMFPYYSWGKNYVTVPLAGRDLSGDVFRVVAAEDGTDITVNGTLVATINAGDHYETTLPGFNSIVTSKAAVLAQFAKGMQCSGNITGDPLMMMIPPREQFLTNYTIVSVAGYTTHWVNVAAPDYALGTIYQDGVLIPNGAFTLIPGTNYYGAQRSVVQGSHTFTSTYPFGVFVYGWNNTDSYGYPGGCSLSPVGTVHNVSLAPDTSYGQLNVDNICLTAHVTDNFFLPVQGVLVTFYVSGLNPLTGNGYTDASGNAQYCYTQMGVIAGMDQVFAEVFGFHSDTAVVFWSYTPPCTNPTNGGIVGSDQSGCGTFTPATLNSLLSASGYSGTLEYKWQSSTTGSSSGFSDITGSNSASYAPGPLSQTTWFRRLARVDCTGNWINAAESNVVMITVSAQLPVSITISTPVDTVCAGTPVTFTASPMNEGFAPFFQWKVNGLDRGTSSYNFTFTPLNGDLVSCVVTSSATCATNNPATSSQYPVTVFPVLPVSVTVTAPQSTICAGTTLTFTASPNNQGTTPFYQWKVNGADAGANNQNYTYIPVNGDLVSCTVTSSETCTSNNPASSLPFGVTVNPDLPVGVTVSASQNPVCSGTPVNFSASPINGGLLPAYQWKVNGLIAGTNNPVYAYTPLNGDLVSCVLTSSELCTTNNPATSAQFPVTVNQMGHGIQADEKLEPGRDHLRGIKYWSAVKPDQDQHGNDLEHVAQPD